MMAFLFCLVTALIFFIAGFLTHAYLMTGVEYLKEEDFNPNELTFDKEGK